MLSRLRHINWFWNKTMRTESLEESSVKDELNTFFNGGERQQIFITRELKRTAKLMKITYPIECRADKY